MKFIEPKVELWEQGADMDAIWSHIARCVRVCYQSTPKNNNENDEQFVKRVILSHEPANSVANHLAMLEHGTIYLTFLRYDHIDDYNFYNINKYSKAIKKTPNGKTIYDQVAYITTNLRVLIENNRLNDLQWLSEPTWHERRYTFCFTTNIGVSREFNRHRVNSIAEESTRFCNYSKKNDGQINIGLPVWLLDGDLDRLNKFNSSDWLAAITQIAESSYDGIGELKYNVDYYGAALYFCNICYNKLIERGWLPQQAREVLPLATKTQLVHTAFESDWRHFIALRSEGVSGKPHPNAKLLGDQVAEILNKLLEVK